METQKSNQLTPVFDNYFELKDALVRTNPSMASEKSKELLSAIKSVKMDELETDVHNVWMKVLKNLQEDATHIADSKDVARQRDLFMSLSKNMYELTKVSKYEQPVYYQFCPMADNGNGAADEGCRDSQDSLTRLLPVGLARRDHIPVRHEGLIRPRNRAHRACQRRMKPARRQWSNRSSGHHAGS